jgi:hypothetical protein
VGAKSLKSLVDMDGFEPSTSSMPLRNINHLQAGTPETQDLAKHGVDAGGRHGAAFWGLDSARTPGLHTGLAPGALPHARGCRLM